MDKENGEPATLRAYRALEHRIVTLQLAPGALTTEGALIDLVGLGRTPTREAIQRLAWEGLVEIRPRAGLAIAPLHRGDWLQVVDARTALEVLMAKAAARSGMPAEMKQLEEAALSMQEAVAGGDVTGFLEADKRIDEAIAAAADNQFAARVIAPLQTHSRRFWFRYQDAGGLEQSAGLHLSMARAIIAGGETQAGLQAGRLMSMLRGLADAVARR